MHKYSQLFIERLRAQLKQALRVRMQSDYLSETVTQVRCVKTPSCLQKTAVHYMDTQGSTVAMVPLQMPHFCLHHLNPNKHSDAQEPF